MAYNIENMSLFDAGVILVAILIPPLAILYLFGVCGDFWINLVLWILLIIPGIVHCFYIIAKRQDEYDAIKERRAHPHAH